MGAPANLLGQRFGRLAVLALAGRRLVGRFSSLVWLCRCDCGKTCELTTNTLRMGHTRSCGCLHRERLVTHGRSRTPEYKTWIGMRERCADLADADYGGRGITVSDRWKDSFETFLADMGPRPSPRHSIDRVDNSKGYEPANCRWAAKSDQARNRSSCRIVDYRGERKPLIEWVEQLGLNYNAVALRLRAGWTPERAFTEPLQEKRRRAPQAGVAHA